MTGVINVRVAHLREMGYNSLSQWLEADCNHLYIGRDSRYIKGAKSNKWENPYPVIGNSEQSRIDCINRFKRRAVINLWDCLEELDGKTLGCWCKPQKCHGDVLIDLLKSKNNGMTQEECIKSLPQ